MLLWLIPHRLVSHVTTSACTQSYTDYGREMSYNLFAAVVLFVAGVVFFVIGDTGLGAVFVALGATFVAISQMSGNRKP